MAWAFKRIKPVPARQSSVPDREAMFAAVLQQVQPATMSPDEALTVAWRSALELLENDLPGALVECGTWLGGCSFGLALLQQRIFGRVVRPIHMLDSFAGLPPAGERDGPAAHEYQGRTADPGYLDNCRAAFDDVRRLRDSFGLQPEECRLVRGWFDTTVPQLADELADQGVALLRIDCDWYDPITLVLEHLEPLVTPEGIVILDDYHAWDGAARAVHDYLSRHDLPYRLRQIGPESSPTGVWFRKRAARQFGGPV